MVKPWKEFRGEITRLYIHESLTLRDVQKIMKEQYEFQASVRSYRQHFDKWSLHKYNCKNRQQRRRQQAKSQSQGVLPPTPPMSPQRDLVPVGDLPVTARPVGFAPHIGNFPHVGFFPDRTSCYDGGMASPSPSGDGIGFPGTSRFPPPLVTSAVEEYSRIIPPTPEGACCDPESSVPGTLATEAFQGFFDQRDMYPMNVQYCGGRARIGTWLQDTLGSANMDMTGRVADLDAQPWERGFGGTEK